jgi:hypothetical protein
MNGKHNTVCKHLFVNVRILWHNHRSVDRGYSDAHPLVILMFAHAHFLSFVVTGKLLESRLNTVSSWQSKLYNCNQAFERVLATFTEEDYTPENRDYIARLERVKADIQESVDDLYCSLGLLKEYPSLAAVDGDFVKTLLLCRDKKIEVRKAATSALNEMLNLEDAAEGHHNPLGIFSSVLARAVNNSAIGRYPYAPNLAPEDQIPSTGSHSAH